MGGFESIGQILPRVSKKTKIADELLALQVKKAFEESLNSVFSAKKLPKITPGKFSFGSLTVLVPDPAWSSEFRQKEARILEKLNSTLGKKVVEKLRFKIVAK